MTTRKALLLVFAFLLSIQVIAQSFVMMARPRSSKKWGYVNEKGEFIIPAKYGKCFEFSSDGVAIVDNKSEASYYFINLKGEKIKTASIYFALKEGFMAYGMHGFYDGLVEIRLGNKWGFYDTEGKLAIPAIYDEVTHFSEGVATAKVGNEFYILSKQGEEKHITVKGIYDVIGFSEGLCIYQSNNDLYGFLPKPIHS